MRLLCSADLNASLLHCFKECYAVPSRGSSLGWQAFYLVWVLGGMQVAGTPGGCVVVVVVGRWLRVAV